LAAVLAGAGATLPQRDSTDIRVIYEVQHKIASGKGVFGKAGIIDSPMAVGGWATYKQGNPLKDGDGDGMPDSWETAHNLNPKDPKDGNAVNAEGYTNLEVYLNSAVEMKNVK
jgi:hypothetical protein